MNFGKRQKMQKFYTTRQKKVLSILLLFQVVVAALREQRNTEYKENAKGREGRNHPEKDRIRTSLTLKETINKQSS